MRPSYAIGGARYAAQQQRQQRQQQQRQQQQQTEQMEQGPFALPGFPSCFVTIDPGRVRGSAAAATGGAGAPAPPTQTAVQEAQRVASTPAVQARDYSDLLARVDALLGRADALAASAAEAREAAAARAEELKKAAAERAAAERQAEVARRQAAILRESQQRREAEEAAARRAEEARVRQQAEAAAAAQRAREAEARQRAAAAAIRDVATSVDAAIAAHAADRAAFGGAGSARRTALERLLRGGVGAEAAVAAAEEFGGDPSEIAFRLATRFAQAYTALLANARRWPSVPRAVLRRPLRMYNNSVASAESYLTVMNTCLSTYYSLRPEDVEFLLELTGPDGRGACGINTAAEAFANLKDMGFPIAEIKATMRERGPEHAIEALCML